MRRYTSMQDVPPELGTCSDYYAQGRRIRADAPVAARVGAARPARLYRRQDTEEIPGLTAASRAAAAKAYTCGQCGEMHLNPLGKPLRIHGSCPRCRAR